MVSRLCGYSKKDTAWTVIEDGMRTEVRKVFLWATVVKEINIDASPTLSLPVFPVQYQVVLRCTKVL